MPRASSAIAETPVADPLYDPRAIFHENGPFPPGFMAEAVRTMFRAMPLDPDEPPRWAQRRMQSALDGLAALHPRDEIEVMLGAQAMAAYFTASACWRLGMNLHLPSGDSTRHITAAATAARTFDTLIRALERRQVKPLSIPAGRPAARVWPDETASDAALYWEQRCRRGEDQPVETHISPAQPSVEWSPSALRVAEQTREQEQRDIANQGLDIANTDGILPDGSMIVPPNPTPQQAAYLARRSAAEYQREYEDNLRRGITRFPKIRPLRTGDLVP